MTLEGALASIAECLKNPLAIEDSNNYRNNRKKKLERERKLVESQEQMYAPKYSTLQKQFDL